MRMEWDDNYQISPEKILNKPLSECKNFQVLTICNDGSGRSRAVASELNARNIHTLSLKGGLVGLHNNTEIASLRSFLAGKMNEEIPYVAVILTREECLRYFSFLSMLRRYQYSNSSEAIESLTQLAREEPVR